MVFRKFPNLLYPTLPYFSYFPYPNLKVSLEQNLISNIGFSSQHYNKTVFRKFPTPLYPILSYFSFFPYPNLKVNIE